MSCGCQVRSFEQTELYNGEFVEQNTPMKEGEIGLLFNELEKRVSNIKELGLTLSRRLEPILVDVPQTPKQEALADKKTIVGNILGARCWELGQIESILIDLVERIEL